MSDPKKRARDSLPSEVSDRQRRNAKRRGASTERRVADGLPNGTVYRGVAGDVYVGDRKDPLLMLEVKYRAELKLQSTTELRDFLEQVKRYVDHNWRRGQMWALAVTGGRAFRGPSPSGLYYVIPHEQMVRYILLEQRYGAQLDLDEP